jgi:hypothetical protein
MRYCMSNRVESYTSDSSKNLTRSFDLTKEEHRVETGREIARGRALNVRCYTTKVLETADGIECNFPSNNIYTKLHFSIYR